MLASKIEDSTRQQPYHRGGRDAHRKSGRIAEHVDADRHQIGIETRCEIASVMRRKQRPKATVGQAARNAEYLFLIAAQPHSPKRQIDHQRRHCHKQHEQRIFRINLLHRLFF